MPRTALTTSHSESYCSEICRPLLAKRYNAGFWPFHIWLHFRDPAAPSIFIYRSVLKCRLLFWKALREVGTGGRVPKCHSERLDCGSWSGTDGGCSLVRWPGRLNPRRCSLDCSGRRFHRRPDSWLRGPCGRSLCCWRFCCRCKVTSRLCPPRTPQHMHTLRLLCRTFILGRVTVRRPALQALQPQRAEIRLLRTRFQPCLR